MTKISIVICTYNRELYLPKCFEHLEKQNCSSKDFEIVIINNNSTDSTEKISQEFIKRNPDLNIIYAFEGKPGLSHARNKGIELANGNIIAFIDDDGFAVPEYVSIVKEFVEKMEYKDYIAFGGKVLPCYNPGKEPMWLSKYIDGLVSKVDLGDKVIPFLKKYPAGCNMVFRKEFFEIYGGFNADLHTRGDDKFVFEKLKRAKLKTLYIPQLEVSHFIDDYRLEKDFIVKLSKVIGQSEKIRLADSNIWLKFLKLVEYIMKFSASLIIAFGFLLKSQTSKAEYLILVRWNVLLAFIKKGKDLVPR